MPARVGKRRGRPPGKHYSKSVTIRLPAKLALDLAKEARKAHITLSEMLREAILERYGNDNERAIEERKVAQRDNRRVQRMKKRW